MQNRCRDYVPRFVLGVTLGHSPGMTRVSDVESRPTAEPPAAARPKQPESIVDPEPVHGDNHV
jgi:hypothetical protein